MKDYLIDFCTDHGCTECAYHYSYRCIVLKVLKLKAQYPWTWDKNIKLDNRKIAFLEGI